MSDLTFLFNPTQTQVPCFVDDHDKVVWFNAGDNYLGKILDYTNTSRYLPTLLEAFEYREVSIGVGRPAIYVREEAVYKLLMKSKSQFANTFCHWLAYDVLPALRKKGKYETKPQDQENFNPLALELKINEVIYEELNNKNITFDQKIQLLNIAKDHVNKIKPEKKINTENAPININEVKLTSDFDKVANDVLHILSLKPSAWVYPKQLNQRSQLIEVNLVFLNYVLKNLVQNKKIEKQIKSQVPMYRIFP